MKTSNPHAANAESKIQCVEVLVARNSIAKNLQWTLSVYSLENDPVSRNRVMHDCDVYHFMTFDWRRTIKQLLEENGIQYKIVQYFSPETIHAGIERSLSFNEHAVVSALHQMEETTERPAGSYLVEISSISQPDSNLVFHDEHL